MVYLCPGRLRYYFLGRSLVPVFPVQEQEIKTLFTPPRLSFAIGGFLLVFYRPNAILITESVVSKPVGGDMKRVYDFLTALRYYEENFTAWCGETYALLRPMALVTASILLYAAVSMLFGYFWLFLFWFVIMCIILYLSWAVTSEHGIFLCAWADEPNSFYKWKFAVLMQEWKENSKWWNTYIEGEFGWIPGLLLYLPCLLLSTVLHVIFIFIGIFDNMRHDFKKVE